MAHMLNKWIYREHWYLTLEVFFSTMNHKIKLITFKYYQLIYNALSSSFIGLLKWI
ncbi:hypothetical protein RNAN_1737 [Rheinheimera nanhaiensis E407-8]|uniref:Uncharacterized protein n=1 Tax=Rheinheimera nanhaiensis E407-8 TaxID=562729 RepID=I1DXH1_9GAMM|nr:hypothetical protein RNAN_1737 [Rheinheimera nanhaiensis E407-8]